MGGFAFGEDKYRRIDHVLDRASIPEGRNIFKDLIPVRRYTVNPLLMIKINGGESNGGIKDCQLIC